jgi:hypothetical protein
MNQCEKKKKKRKRLSSDFHPNRHARRGEQFSQQQNNSLPSIFSKSLFPRLSNHHGKPARRRRPWHGRNVLQQLRSKSPWSPSTDDRSAPFFLACALPLLPRPFQTLTKPKPDGSNAPKSLNSFPLWISACPLKTLPRLSLTFQVLTQTIQICSVLKISFMVSTKFFQVIPMSLSVRARETLVRRNRHKLGLDLRFHQRNLLRCLDRNLGIDQSN